MKIELIINADYNKELYLHRNSDKLKEELLSTIKQFIGKDVQVDYYKEDAQIDSATGEVVNYNPYPPKFITRNDIGADIPYLAKVHPVIVVDENGNFEAWW